MGTIPRPTSLVTTTAGASRFASVVATSRASSTMSSSPRPASISFDTQRVRQSSTANASGSSSRTASATARGASTVSHDEGRDARCRWIRSVISSSRASAVTTMTTARSEAEASFEASADFPLRAPPSSTVRPIRTRSHASHRYLRRRHASRWPSPSRCRRLHTAHPAHRDRWRRRSHVKVSSRMVSITSGASIHPQFIG